MGGYGSRTEPEILDPHQKHRTISKAQNLLLNKAHRPFSTFLLRGLFLSNHTFPGIYRKIRRSSVHGFSRPRLGKMHALEDLGVDPSSQSWTQVSTQIAELDEACKHVRKLLSILVERMHGVK